MYFYYGIKNSTLEMQEEKPLELKIPEDRMNNLLPPDQMQQQQQYTAQQPYVDPQQQYMTTQMEDPYAGSYAGSYAPPTDGYSQQTSSSNPLFVPHVDPLAEDPWSKYD